MKRAFPSAKNKTESRQNHPHTILRRSTHVRTRYALQVVVHGINTRHVRTHIDSVSRSSLQYASVCLVFPLVLSLILFINSSWYCFFSLLLYSVSHIPCGGARQFFFIFPLYSFVFLCFNYFFGFLSFIRIICKSCISYPIRWCGIALSTPLTAERCSISVAQFCDHITWISLGLKNRHGWLCWMSTGKKNGSM